LFFKGEDTGEKEKTKKKKGKHASDPLKGKRGKKKSVG